MLALEKEKTLLLGLDSTTIAIIIGTAIISILLIALLIKSHKNAKRRELDQSVNRDYVERYMINAQKTTNNPNSYQNPYIIPDSQNNKDDQNNKKY
jgi:type II secretory pathway pseudopilin PulG